MGLKDEVWADPVECGCLAIVEEIDVADGDVLWLTQVLRSLESSSTPSSRSVLCVFGLGTRQWVESGYLDPFEKLNHPRLGEDGQLPYRTHHHCSQAEKEHPSISPARFLESFIPPRLSRFFTSWKHRPLFAFQKTFIVQLAIHLERYS
jgi:hypothetical protein